MSTTLENELNDLRTQSKEKLPPAVSAVFAADAERTEKTVERDKFAQVGATVGEFTLPDANGGETSLSELVADGPAVLVFYRGAWCPYCNVALRAYQRDLLPELNRRGVRLAAISPQIPDGSLSAKEANGLEYSVLSDVGNIVARGLGITFRTSDEVREAQSSLGLDLGVQNGTGEWELPHPAVAVVAADRTIQFLDVHPDYTTRTDPAQVLAALDER
ncbi:peroxiredoxin-like family protein [Amycolatopsis jiangsuensis]|uniref:thioredoxin-dependent peroxiredoxin n=1 Tax=Amycolatopsis jiangsuensis TaxID=1181879 RepID=A0A840J0R6_9PSEU|nr:peroxiredoxin-like family protein [Amycolatopsis jiangsuensis]MBB4687670.1 peroxiredoxin [Amycolatopsis jiangsuensis]